MKTKEEADEFFRRLEAERNDLSYLRPNRFEPKRYKSQPEIMAEREAFFQAGRYAEGARDDKAKAGNRQAKRLANQR